MTQKPYIREGFHQVFQGKATKIAKEEDFERLLSELSGSKPKIPRVWQQECFEELRRHRRNIMNAFMGAGKSVAISMLNHYWLMQDTSLKAVVSVPQHMIAKGYQKSRVIFGGDDVWMCPNILEGTSTGVIKALYDFLSCDIPKNKKIKFLDNTDQRVIVCTHSALARLFAILGDPKRDKKKFPKGRKEVFRDTVLWVDEAQHLGSETVEVLGKCSYESNGIADVATYFVRNDLRVNLATATMFRGDGDPLLAPDCMEKFSGRYSLPFDRYMDEVCIFLKEIRYQWVFFYGSYAEGVTKVFSSDGIRKTAIYIPYVGTKYSMSSKGMDSSKRRRVKHSEVMKVIQSISPRASIQEHKHEKHGCTYYTIKFRGETLRIVDLVRERGRNRVMNYIREQNLSRNPDIDVVVALGTFKEGADYAPLERVIIVDKRDSIVENIQMVGRSTRDYPGKRSAYVYHLLPAGVRHAYSKDDLPVVLNNYLKCFVVHLLVEQFFSPRTVKIRTKKLDKKGKRKTIVTTRPNPWSVLEEYQVKEAFDKILAKMLPRYTGKASVDTDMAKSVCFEVLEEFGVTDEEQKRSMFDYLQSFMVEKSGRVFKRGVEGIDVSLMDDEENMFGWLDAYVSRPLDCKTLREVREKCFERIPASELVELYIGIFKKRQKEGLSFRECLPKESSSNWEESMSARMVSSLRRKNPDIDAILKNLGISEEEAMRASKVCDG